MARKKQEVIWHIRVGEILDELVEKAVMTDIHVTKSELVKDAVKWYLEQKFPKLVEKARG